MNEKETKEYLLGLICEVGQNYKELVKDLPYQINLAKLIGTNENAHTRIFSAILKYNKDGRYRVLEQFLKRFAPNAKYGKPQITYQYLTEAKRSIDLLLQVGDSIFIIENKVCGAVDQKNQLQDYIEDVIKHKGKNPYVIYLKRDTNKMPAKESISTEKLYQYLGYKSEKDTGRFILLNYKHDILPWLEDVVKIIDAKETCMHAMLHQYIDYLKLEFELSEDQIKIKKMTKEVLEKNLDKFNLEYFLLTENGIKELIDDKIREIGLISILKPIKSEIVDKNDSLFDKIDEDSQTFERGNINMKFALRNSKYCVSVAVAKSEIYWGLWHEENNKYPNDNYINTYLRQKMESSVNDDSSNDWVWYEYLMNFKINDDFWKLLDKDNVFVEFLVSRLQKFVQVILKNDKDIKSYIFNDDK